MFGQSHDLTRLLSGVLNLGWHHNERTSLELVCGDGFFMGDEIFECKTEGEQNVKSRRMSVLMENQILA